MRLYQVTEDGVDETSELRNLIYLQQLRCLLNVSPGEATAVVFILIGIVYAFFTGKVDVINQETGCDKEFVSELIGIGDNLVHRE